MLLRATIKTNDSCPLHPSAKKDTHHQPETPRAHTPVKAFFSNVNPVPPPCENHVPERNSRKHTCLLRLSPAPKTPRCPRHKRRGDINSPVCA